MGGNLHRQSHGDNPHCHYKAIWIVLKIWTTSNEVQLNKAMLSTQII